MTLLQKIPGAVAIFSFLILVSIFATILHMMGQPLICKCGYVKLWHGYTMSSENSQHLSDWYSFSHIIHGFIFYFLLWLLNKKFPIPLPVRFLLAMGIEMGWELFENTDFVINRYREVTISLDYFGDSVINSVMDVTFAALGFYVAKISPVWIVVAAAILMELYVGFSIRDNLTLNIIMLIYPFEGILNWQQG